MTDWAAGGGSSWKGGRMAEGNKTEKKNKGLKIKQVKLNKDQDAKTIRKLVISNQK